MAQSQREWEQSVKSRVSCWVYETDNTFVSTYVIYPMIQAWLAIGTHGWTYLCMKHRCKLPHICKLGVVLQIQCIFTPNTTMEELEKCVYLPLIQGYIKSDLGKFELCTGSERSPRLGGVPRSWVLTLWMVFTILFKFDDLGWFICVQVVFCLDGIKPWLLGLFSNVGSQLWSRVAVGCHRC